MPATGLLGDLTTASPEEISRRFKSIIAATEWAPATQIFDLAFADLVEHAYRAPRLFTYVDLFCGAGGSSVGLTMAGGQLLKAVNHDERAIETHSKAFRGADHACADLDHYDMRKLPYAHMLWGSPICWEVSPSAGKGRARKPRAQVNAYQQELLKYGPVADSTFERTRATFYDIIRACEVHDYPIVIVENVVEAALEWKLFWHFLSMMEFLGKEWQILNVSAAHVGDELNPHAAQRRDRMYIVFNKIGVPRPDLSVRPQSICEECGLVDGYQKWKPKSAGGVPTASGRLLPVGKYGRNGQYWYHCPNPGCDRIVTPLERPAASIIDWSDLGCMIGEREANGERPLVPNTLNRLLRGMREHRRPVVATVAGNTFERPGYTRAWPVDTTPFMTRVRDSTDALATPHEWSAFLDANGGSWNTGSASVYAPFRARTTKEWEALCTAGVEPLIDVARAHAVPQPAASNPLQTVSTARHNALVVPYYRTGVAKPAASTPFPTMATRDTCGLATPGDYAEVTMEDVMRARYRMISSEEAKRAQRFPRFYEITGNQGEQMAQAGNAVCTSVAQMIGERCAVSLNRTTAHV